MQAFVLSTSIHYRRIVKLISYIISSYKHKISALDGKIHDILDCKKPVVSAMYYWCSLWMPLFLEYTS